ncbi:alkaline ceramidase 3-like protein [Coemansia mojavensis]|nr:alkaline ceramidase 3-like protein [Coemansia mojavensis]KAJ2650983.1 alkaline ceramidase ydc1 [Coemansia sp. RSA 1250]
MGMIIEDSVRNATAYYWGERTSTIDWCEENYAISNYVAEFWNTFTNAVMITLAVLGIQSSIRHKHGKRITAMYIGLLLVGCGSTSFHATLKYTTQMLDELPMLYLCGLALYSLLEINTDIVHGIKVPILLGLFQISVTLIYLFWIQNPVFHQVAFAIMVLGSIYLAFRRLNELQISKETRRTMSRLHIVGQLGMWGGFLVWNIDNIFCHQLRSYRSYLGMPLDGILQLHGWWHIMTAYGSAYLIMWAHMIKLARLGHDHLFSVRYFMGLFPYIGLRQPKKID